TRGARLGQQACRIPPDGARHFSTGPLLRWPHSARRGSAQHVLFARRALAVERTRDHVGGAHSRPDSTVVACNGGSVCRRWPEREKLQEVLSGHTGSCAALSEGGVRKQAL